MESSSRKQRNESDTGLEQRIERLGVVPPNLPAQFLLPVVEGYIRYEQLFDGSITIYDIELINHLISYKADVNLISNRYYREKAERENRYGNRR
jgi:hypothetical protein